MHVVACLDGQPVLTGSERHLDYFLAIAEVDPRIGLRNDHADPEAVGVHAEVIVARYSVVRVADEIVVDLMANACGVDYADAIRDAVEILFTDVSIPVASPPTLIRTKNTIRPSDAADRQFLQVLIDEAAR